MEPNRNRVVQIEDLAVVNSRGDRMWAACSKIQAVTDPERVGRLQEKSTRAKQNQLGTAAD
jgi:hypothetical protein